MTTATASMIWVPRADGQKKALILRDMSLQIYEDRLLAYTLFVVDGEIIDSSASIKLSSFKTLIDFCGSCNFFPAESAEKSYTAAEVDALIVNCLASEFSSVSELLQAINSMNEGRSYLIRYRPRQRTVVSIKHRIFSDGVKTDAQCREFAALLEKTLRQNFNYDNISVEFSPIISRTSTVVELLAIKKEEEYYFETLSEAMESARYGIAHWQDELAMIFFKL